MASVLLQAASSRDFRAGDEMFTFIVTPVKVGELDVFSASTATSTLPGSILLFLQTSANMITPQPASAMAANSSGVGPALVPPAASERSHIILCPRPSSDSNFTFSISFAFPFIFAINFTVVSCFSTLLSMISGGVRGDERGRIRRLVGLGSLVCSCR